MRIGLICTIAIAAVALACSSDRSYAPPGTVLTDAQVSADVASSAGIAVASSIDDQAQYLDHAGISAAVNTPSAPGLSGGTPASIPGSTSAPSGTKPVCDYSAATGRWTCAPFVNAHGLTVLWSYAYSDAVGKPMEKYDALATEKIDYRSQLSGPVGNGTSFVGVTHRTSEQTSSGLAGRETTRVWNGVGVSGDTVSYHDASGGSRRYAGIEIDSVKAVTYRQPRTLGSYPLSGQLVRVARYTVTAAGKSNETRSVSRTVVTTFDGSADVSIRLGSMSCTLHLATRKVDGCVG